MNVNKLIAGTIFSLLSLAPRSINAWQIAEEVDEISDAVTYEAISTGMEVEVNSICRYKPELRVRISPISLAPDNKMQYKCEVFITIAPERFMRGDQNMIIRIDAESPLTVTGRASVTRDSLFIPSSIKDRLIKSGHTAVRYDTSLGRSRTAKFDTSGLNEALLDIKSRYIKLINR